MARPNVAALHRRRVRWLPPPRRDVISIAHDPAYAGDVQLMRSVVGPTLTRGSTSAADINDTQFVSSGLPGIPPHFTYGSDDFHDGGDVLDAVLQNAFTIQAAVAINAADIAAAGRAVFDKGIGIEFRFGLGKVEFLVYHGGAGGNRDAVTSTNAFAAGRHIITVTRNPALARSSRHALYSRGGLIAFTDTAVGIDGVVIDTASPFRLGVGTANPGNLPVSAQFTFYLWPVVLTAAEILEAANYTYYQRGWQ